MPRQHPRAAIALVAALAMAATGLSLVSRDGDLRDADAVLRTSGAVTVLLPGGATRPAIDGETLPRGAVVTTGTGSSATIEVRERLVRLAPETTVMVPDGAAADLRRGSILVDRRKGPGITVRAGAVTVDEVDEGAVRVDRGFSVRVSVLSGGARATTSDRGLDVARLYQVAIAGRALPDRPTPLRLTGDDWEELVIPAVTSADAELSQLARGIDVDVRLAAPTRVQILPAAYRGALAELPRGVGRSEALLPVAIGLAVDSSRVSTARQLRAEGGSWGVVASLVGARTGAVSARLAELLAGPGEGQPTGGPLAGGTAGPGVLPTGGTDRPDPSPTRPRPSRTPGPSGSPSPSPSSTDVVGTIRELIPSGTPTATPLQGFPRPASPTPATPVPPTPTPAPDTGLAGILKALLG